MRAFQKSPAPRIAPRVIKNRGLNNHNQGGCNGNNRNTNDKRPDSDQDRTQMTPEQKRNVYTSDSSLIDAPSGPKFVAHPGQTGLKCKSKGYMAGCEFTTN